MKFSHGTTSSAVKNKRVLPIPPLSKPVTASKRSNIKVPLQNPASSVLLDELKKQVEELTLRNDSVKSENRELLEENKRNKERLSASKETLERLKKEFSTKQR